MTSPSWIGYTLNGRYQITELLGQGGMSSVYKATDPNLKRVVAIKLIHSHLSSNAEFVRRFEEEATAVAQLRHPHIVQVHDFNHDNDNYYIVFEYVPGETLKDRLMRLHESSRTMPVNEVLQVSTQIGQALNYAHQRKLVHRDVKPANILLNVQNEAILTDFGIVKITGGTQHTATGALLGTAQYMSPEQIRGTSVDARSDIYSFGVMLFEMVGGRPPFLADSAMTLMMMHLADPVPDLHNIRPETVPGLVTIIKKALDKDLANRYQTIAELLNDLQNIQEEKVLKPLQSATFSTQTPLRQDATEILSPSTFSPHRERNRNLWIAGGSLAGVGLIVLFLWLGSLLGKADVERQETPTAVAVSERDETSEDNTAVSTKENTASPTSVPSNTPSPTATLQPTATLTPQPTATPPPPLTPPSNASLNTTWIRPEDEMVMVYVPGGTFQMGSDPALDSFAEIDEQPQHEVTLDSFWIDQTEITNAQFSIFVEATNYMTTAEIDGNAWVRLGAELEQLDGANWRHPGGPDTNLDGLNSHPVTQIAWDDAAAYCEWTGTQLPTEAQWEYAAIGSNNLLFPWGNTFDGNITNFCDINCVYPQSNKAFDDGYIQTAPVGSYPDGASWVNALDMIGNVWEWTNNFYLPYPDNIESNDLYGEEFHVLRGGSWVDGAKNSRPANRTINRASRYELLGFRCVLPTP